jgi:nucleoside-diphosphate-sugar epimerase
MSTGKPTVFVTGAAGRIGSYFVEHYADRYALTCMVESDEQVEQVSDYGNVVVAKLADRERLVDLMTGSDTVVHLAANPSPSTPWDSVLHDNIIGTYHALDAAVCAGAQRIVYASSIHAVSGYPPGRQIRPTDTVNPGDLYGVSKCFGEALCRYMARQHERSCIAIRIGAFQPKEKAQDPGAVPLMNLFVSDRDLAHLISRCIDAPADLRFAIVHGVSRNRFTRLDLTETFDLVGYEPQDDMTELNPALKDLDLGSKVTPHDRRHSG